jgi:hypothetical protein
MTNNCIENLILAAIFSPIADPAGEPGQKTLVADSPQPVGTKTD